jgi:hypothetical protein
MKITADSHTYDGTGRAGFCPLDPITTQAKTRAGILKAWSKAVNAEYARHLAFQERYNTAWCDAQAINGVWIAEGHASDGAHRYRMTAYAEKGAAPTCGVFDTRRDFSEYAAEAETIAILREKYATR